MTGLDRILNEAIKAVLEAITIPLIDTVTTYLFKGKIPECYKEIIIVILQKANKKDYLLLRSYRLVTLKNTLRKILEKIAVEYI